MRAAARLPGRFPAGRWVAILAACVLACLWLVPWAGMERFSSIDRSWMLALDASQRQGAQFGRDVVFTFGPLHRLYTAVFDPETWRSTVLAWCLGASAIAWAWLRFGRAVTGFAVASLAILFAISARSSGFEQGTSVRDPIFFCVGLLLLHFVDIDGDVVGLMLLSAVCAAIVLIKFSFVPTTLAALGLADVMRIARGRFPVVTLATFLLVGLFDVLSGQDPHYLFDYLRAGFAVARDYGESMQVDGPAVEIWLYLAAALLVTMVAFVAEARTAGQRNWSAVLFLALLLFVAMKAGFVRHDRTHAMIAWGTLGCATALQGVRVAKLCAAGGHSPRPLVLAAGSVLALVLVMRGWSTPGSVPAFLDDLFGTGLLLRVEQAADLIGGSGLDKLDREREEIAARLRRTDPVLPVEGSVDIIPTAVEPLLAAGLSYRGRPVPQSYSAYSPALIARDRAFLDGRDAPRTLLFSLDAIDGRLPAMEEGALWPDLLARYRPVGENGRFLQLERRPRALDVALTPLERRSAAWDVDIPLPPAPRLWMRATFATAPLAPLVSLIWKCAPLAVLLSLDDGRQIAQRILPTVAAEGFLVSPYLDSPAEFAALPDDRDAGQNVRAIRFLAPGGFNCRTPPSIEFDRLGWRQPPD